MISGSASIHSDWRRSEVTTLLAVGGILLLSVAAYWVTWSSMVDVWAQRAGYSHGYLIALLCVAMIVMLRAQLTEEPPAPVPLMLIPLIAASVIWVIMVLASIQVLHQMLLPILTWCAVFAACGWRIAKILFIPIFYLYMAIPLWDIANPYLQIMTVEAIEFLLNIVGISAYIDQNIVTLPNGVFEIAGGCSGLHFMVVGLSIGLLYAHFYTQGVLRFTATVACAAVFALLANWIRVFVVIAVGYMTDMQHYLVTVDHYYFGWVVFAGSLIPFYYVARKLERFDQPIQSVPSDRRVGSGASQLAMLSVLVAVAVSMVTTSLFLYGRQKDPGSTDIAVVLPQHRASWRQNDSSTGDWAPFFSGPAAESGVTYTNGVAEIQVYANVYLLQTQGRELIGFVNRIEGNNRWHTQQSSKREVRLDVTQYRELILGDDFRNVRVVVFWYEIGGRRIVSDLGANLTYAVLRLFSDPMAGIVAVSARCDSNCDTARQRILSWLQGHDSTSERLLRLDDIVQEHDVESISKRAAAGPHTPYYVHRASARNPLVFMSFLRNSEKAA